MNDRRQAWKPALLAALLTLALVGCGNGGSSGNGGGGDGMSGMGSPSPTTGRTSGPITDFVEPPGNQPLETFTLTAAPATIDGNQFWAFNGQVPGPELRVTVGDRLRVTLVNHLPQPTSIHWHGLAVPAAEDGVPGVTQDAVGPGKSYTYEFVVRTTGTYWYHSHEDTVDQLPQGLFGPLVVEPQGGHVAQARDAPVVLHNYPNDNGVAMNGSPNEVHVDAGPGQTVRLRVIDAFETQTDGRPLTVAVVGASYQVVALDGHDLNQPGSLDLRRIQMDIGQRVDVVFTMPSSGSVELVNGDSPPPYSRGQQGRYGWVTVGDGSPASSGDPSKAPLFDPTHYGSPTADSVAAGPFSVTDDVTLSDQLGFMDGHLANLHPINGKLGMNGTMFQVQYGQLVRFHIVSTSDDWHPMHLHGHVFSVIGWNGQKLAGSPLHEDTVLLPPHQTVDVAFRADDPGLWMFHCHVLSHAHDGMMAMVDYAGVTTPYQPGGSADNQPE